jgi:phosphoenolpyruvate carboxylase
MDTFRTAMMLGPKVLGAYVISMASSPSDILTVVLLQKTAATSMARCVAPRV